MPVALPPLAIATKKKELTRGVYTHDKADHDYFGFLGRRFCSVYGPLASLPQQVFSAALTRGKLERFFPFFLFLGNIRVSQPHVQLFCPFPCTMVQWGGLERPQVHGVSLVGPIKAA